MIKIGDFASSAAALSLADYCKNQQLDVSVVVHSAEQAELWCASEHAELVVAELERFLLNPYADRYQAAAWDRAEVVDSGTGSAGLSGYWQQLWVNGGWFCHLVWLSTLLVYGWQQVDPWSALAALQLKPELGLSLEQGWRWFTPGWLHFSGSHLVFNLIWVWYLLGPLELKSGRVVAISLTLLVLLFSNLAQFVMVGAHFGGMSGLVYGLFGFYWICGWLKPNWGLQISTGLIGFMLIWLVIGFFDLLWISMANWAHLAGLLTGMFCAVLLVVANKVLTVQR
ncbi:MAG: rhomboid family intramembrane serine protease [Gammaproteobacteria bacterium]|nr:rhomboid family intramembrane serine protease [Gammaproteobacteria bacterium]MBU2056148.1 rhomboid family intramembrane serine protease [Gammaproteobacteria bacterium]MBU2175666.1 rhomboid family intramembrane serine protease [Gammaproteobacteria bacterium]MBU2245373.1 rhomboid family intramembrane serine protease [Gammaproteobacteria bacterium]MBU2345764.1 rhomboid family intramembrane serine protease [Gammaproteobacteria bacterium]